jgi:hypothetical protein
LSPSPTSLKNNTSIMHLPHAIEIWRVPTKPRSQPNFIKTGTKKSFKSRFIQPGLDLNSTPQLPSLTHLDGPQDIYLED